MTTTDRPQRKRTCISEGCRRRSGVSKHEYCCYTCMVLDEEMNRARRVCDAIGPSTDTTELWLTVVELNDLWTKYQQQDKKLFDVAESVGFTDKQWAALKRGARDPA